MSSTETTAARSIHIRTWSGSLSAVVTEMANAGRRGKVCRTLRLSGSVYEQDPGYGEVFHFFCGLAELSGEESLDDVLLLARALQAEVPEFKFYEETIRGIDAPRVRLVAGVEGAWIGSADEDGVGLADLRDRANEPRARSRGTPARAYTLAAKVWARVQAARTYPEALDVLRDAGLDLSTYCAVD